MPAETLSVRVEQRGCRPAGVLYDLISDVTRMPDYSPETVAVRWLGDATRPNTRSQVQGRQPDRLVEVVHHADRGHRRTGPAVRLPGAGYRRALWTYRFEPGAGRALVTESMAQTQPSPAILRFLRQLAGVTDRADHLRQGMRTTLDRLATAAEQSVMAVG